MRHRILIRVMLALLVLTQIGAAQERIGLLRVLSGSPQLDGVPVSRAALAREGQTLLLPEGATAKISILESNQEVYLREPGTRVLNKKELLRWARTASRGGVDVAADLGSRQLAAGNTLRTKELVTINELKPVLPPKPDRRGKYSAIHFQPQTPLLIEEGREIQVTLTELEADSSSAPLTGTYPGGESQPLTQLPLEDPLHPGVTYRLSLRSEHTGHQDSVLREVDFRILTTEEEQYLSSAVKKLDSPQADRRALWQLADLYSSLGQPVPLLKTLKRIQNSYKTVPPQSKEETDEKKSLPSTITNLESNVYLRLPGLKERGT